MTQDNSTTPKRALGYSVIFCILSLPLALLFTMAGLAALDGSANGYFVTFNLFLAQDVLVGPAMAAVIFAAWRWGARLPVPDAKPRTVLLIALLAMILSVALRFWAHHNYPLSLDEFMPTFQAAIFRNGQLMAPLSDTALEMSKNLQPFFTYVDEERQVWIQHYRPIHAAILSLFPAAYDQAIAHAILTGITVVAIGSIGRQVFPERAGAPALAALLLVTSPQVLLTSASGFAFTTHLAFNTVWLALFLRGSWSAHVCAAIVGFFALGIHQVHVHAIYVFPFGIAMLLGYFGSRWKTVPYIVAYLVGVPVWIMWPEIATWLHTGDPSALPSRLIEIEYLANYLEFSSSVGVADRQFSVGFLIVNIWRFLLWMSPAVVLLLALAILKRRQLGTVAVVCAIGFLFTVFMSHLMLPNQMHTIGSRYYHAALTNLVVVCLAAYYVVFESERWRKACLAALVGGLVIFLPWRAFQIHQKVGPRAEVQARLDALDVDSVLIASSGVWFMPDFIRNDPFLRNRPVFYLAEGLDLEQLSPGTIATVTGADLVEDGFPRGTYLEPAFELNSR